MQSVRRVLGMSALTPKPVRGILQRTAYTRERQIGAGILASAAALAAIDENGHDKTTR